MLEQFLGMEGGHRSFCQLTVASVLKPLGNVNADSSSNLQVGKAARESLSRLLSVRCQPENPTTESRWPPWFLLLVETGSPRLMAPQRPELIHFAVWEHGLWSELTTWTARCFPPALRLEDPGGEERGDEEEHERRGPRPLPKCSTGHT